VVEEMGNGGGAVRWWTVGDKSRRRREAGARSRRAGGAGEVEGEREREVGS